MKKTLLIIAVFLIASTSAFSQFQFGVGGAAGTKAGFDDDGALAFGFGPHVRGVYTISDDFALVGGVTYYLPKKIGDVSLNQFVFNVDLNYNFINDGDMKAYFLGGASYNSFKIAAGGASVTFSEFGYHAGAGVVFDKFFIEGKYEFEIDTDDILREGQITGTIGIFLN